MIDHLGLNVADYPRAKAFYTAVLATLGHEPVMEVTKEQSGGYEGCGFGPPRQPKFWIGTGESRTGGAHVCFTAASRAEVDAFHAAALSNGARDNGAPGLRPHYHSNYYGAYAYDLDGHNIEAVCHLPEA